MPRCHEPPGPYDLPAPGCGDGVPGRGHRRPARHWPPARPAARAEGFPACGRERHAGACGAAHRNAGGRLGCARIRSQTADRTAQREPAPDAASRVGFRRPSWRGIRSAARARGSDHRAERGRARHRARRESTAGARLFRGDCGSGCPALWRGGAAQRQRAQAGASIVALRVAAGRGQPLPARQSDACRGAGTRLRRVPHEHRIPGAGQPAAHGVGEARCIQGERVVLRCAGRPGSAARLHDSRQRLHHLAAHAARAHEDRGNQLPHGRRAAQGRTGRTGFNGGRRRPDRTWAAWRGT